MHSYNGQTVSHIEKLNADAKAAVEERVNNLKAVHLSRKESLGKYNEAVKEAREFFESLGVACTAELAQSTLDTLLHEEAVDDKDARRKAKKLAQFLADQLGCCGLGAIVYSKAPEPEPEPPATVEPKATPKIMTDTEAIVAELTPNLERSLSMVGASFGVLTQYSARSHCAYSIENSISLSRVAPAGIWATRTELADMGEEYLKLASQGKLPSGKITVPRSQSEAELELEDSGEDERRRSTWFRVKVWNIAECKAVQEVLRIPTHSVGSLDSLKKGVRTALEKSNCHLLADRRTLAEYIAVCAIASTAKVKVDGYDLKKLVAAGKSKNGKGIRKAVFAAKEALKVLYAENKWGAFRLIETKASAA